MTRTILILTLVPFLGGCDMEQVLIGNKTETQKYHEARAEQGLPPPVNLWSEPEREPEPVCQEIWRSVSCVDGKEHEWVW